MSWDEFQIVGELQERVEGLCALELGRMRPDFADDKLQLSVRLLQQLDALVDRLLGVHLGLGRGRSLALS